MLLATKLNVPGLRPGFVFRPRLAQRLDEGLGQGLILVCAPAGSGKTVLLADWARLGRPPAAWLSLDDADNDPARFWRHALAALDHVRPGISERVSPLLGPPAPVSFEGLVTALINELAAGPDDGERPLVLDDYHLIGSQPVHASLGFLLEHRPPGLGVVLASRSDPPLPLARLRARGQLAELRAAELRFTAGEAAAMLREAAGADLPDAAVAALADRTEGWAAGLQLAALSLRGQADVAGFVTAFTGSNRYVLDFLAEEVLERQSEQVRAFLLETSVLERLSGELCDAVTGRPGSQPLLEQVERAGLFLLPLDEVRGWWRYHHLFADLLRARLQDEQPGRAAQLHRNAATWYEEHGLADDAIGHAVAAGEMTWAARLIEQHFDAVTIGAARGRRSSGGCLRSPPTWSVPSPAVAGSGAGGSNQRQPGGGGAAARRGRARVCRHSRRAIRAYCWPGGSMLVNVPALIALHRSYLAQLRGDAEGTAAFASWVLAELGEGERLLSSLAQWNLAVAEWLRGRLAEAGRAFMSSITRWRAAGQPTLTAYGGYQLGQVQRAQGHLDATVQTCLRSLDFTAPPDQPTPPAAGPAYVGLAEVTYQRDELDTALRHVTEGIVLCRQFVYTAPLAGGLATLAWIRQATGDPAGALEAIGEAGQASPGPAGPLNPVPAQRARLLLAQGDLPPPSAGRKRTASPRTTSRTTPGSPGIWCWPGCCSPRTGPARHWRCWIVCMRRRSPRTGLAASSSSAPTGRCRWRPRPGTAAITALAGALSLPRASYVRVFATALTDAALLLADRGPAGRPGRGRGPVRLPGPAPARI